MQPHKEISKPSLVLWLITVVSATATAMVTIVLYFQQPNVLVPSLAIWASVVVLVTAAVFGNRVLARYRDSKGRSADFSTSADTSANRKTGHVETTTDPEAHALSVELQPGE